MELMGSPRGADSAAQERERRKAQASWRLRVGGIGGGLILAGLVALAYVSQSGDGSPAAREEFSLGLSASHKGNGIKLAAGRGVQQLASMILANSDANSSATDSALGGNSSQGACARPEHRRIYYVNQLFWSFEYTLVVSASNSSDPTQKSQDGAAEPEKLGYVKSAPFSFNSEQKWTDLNGRVLARSRQDAITTVTNVFVEDCDHKQLATISEAFSPSNSAVTQYTIQNSEGDIVALSTFAKDFGTEVEINDQQSGKRLVTIFKGWGQWSDAWVAKFRPGMEETLANDPRVIVMLLSAASSSHSWGLGGPLAVLLNPLWLLFLCCCLCACCTAFSRVRENRGYDEIPGGAGGNFFGQGQSTGYGSGGPGYGRTEYV